MDTRSVFALIAEKKLTLSLKWKLWNSSSSFCVWPPVLLPNGVFCLFQVLVRLFNYLCFWSFVVPAGGHLFNCTKDLSNRLKKHHHNALNMLQTQCIKVEARPKTCIIKFQCVVNNTIRSHKLQYIAACDNWVDK